MAQAQTVGRTVLRIADADVLPLRFALADAIDGCAELHKLQDDKRTRNDELSKLIDRRAFALVADPMPVPAPEREPDVPYVNLAPLDNTLVRLKKKHKGVRRCVRQVCARRGHADGPDAHVAECDAAGHRADIDGRARATRTVPSPIYAPGTQTGYAAKTLPGCAKPSSRIA